MTATDLLYITHSAVRGMINVITNNFINHLQFMCIFAVTELAAVAILVLIWVVDFSLDFVT